MSPENYKRISEEKKAEERKSLIDMETSVKQARSSLKIALDCVSVIGVNDETWALAHYLYGAIEDCDKALGIVYSKERIADVDVFDFTSSEPMRAWPRGRYDWNLK